MSKSASSFAYPRVGIAQLGQISGARAGVQVGQHPIVELFGFHLGHAAVGVVDIPEDNGFGGAGGLACGLDFAIPHLAALFFRVDLGGIDSLHAVRTLFHDAAAAHGDVGIVQQLEAGRFVIGEQEEIEAAHFVGTVVGAVAGADATVINHVVEALARVTGGLHGADQLAGGVLALHARDGLIIDLGIGDFALVVTVDAQPVHGAAAANLVLADDGDVVFGLTRHHARATARAGSEIDGHAPRVTLVLPLGVESETARRVFGAGMHRLGILLVVLDIAGAEDVAAGVERVLVLGGGEHIAALDLLGVQSAVVP